METRCVGMEEMGFAQDFGKKRTTGSSSAASATGAAALAIVPLAPPAALATAPVTPDFATPVTPWPPPIPAAFATAPPMEAAGGFFAGLPESPMEKRAGLTGTTWGEESFMEKGQNPLVHTHGQKIGIM